jgi:hypothetical protein
VTVPKTEGNAQLKSIQISSSSGIFTRPHIGLLAEHGPEAIIPLTGPNRGNGLGHSFTIHSSPVINVGAGTDIGDLRSVLEEQARTIAQEVRRIIEIDFEREVVV